MPDESGVPEVIDGPDVTDGPEVDGVDEPAARSPLPDRESGEMAAPRPTRNPRRAIEDDRPAEPDPATARRRHRLLRPLLKPGKGQLIAAAMLFLVGMGGVMQIRSNTADSAYANSRREDLIVLLDGLGEQSQRLESEISDLEQTKSELESGADTQRVAREEARQRVDNLSILAGTAPAIGPGIRLRIVDPGQKMTFDVLLDAVEEMRDAGAEVIEVNDSIRVVASTWFGRDASGGLVVDGQSVDTPYVLDVIGDPHSLEEAARFRGGIVSEITGPRIGGQVRIEQIDRVVVDSLHAPTKNQYAQPASPQPTPR